MIHEILNSDEPGKSCNLTVLEGKKVLVENKPQNTSMMTGGCQSATGAD